MVRAFASLLRESGISLSCGVMSVLDTMCHSESRLSENLQHLEVGRPALSTDEENTGDYR